MEPLISGGSRTFVVREVNSKVWGEGVGKEKNIKFLPGLQESLIKLGVDPGFLIGRGHHLLVIAKRGWVG